MYSPRTGRLDLAQAIVSASLTGFIVVAAAALRLPVPALCVALLAVPLEAAASGSRRGLFAAGMSMLIGFVVAFQIDPAEALSLPLFGILTVAAMVVLAHMSARLLVESKLDGMLARRHPSASVHQNRT